VATVPDICNLALGHLGSAAEVTSIDPPDGSYEASQCARLYPFARREALEAHDWTWSKTRVALAQAPTNPSEVWTYAYAKPSDMVQPLRVLQQVTLFDFYQAPWPSLVTADEMVLWSERGTAQFEMEGDLILTHEPDAVLLYKKDITDTTKWSTTFGLYLSYVLGAMLAGPIVKGDAGVKTAMGLRKIAAAVLGQAATQNANSSAETNEFIPEALRRR
jgi:hypothetical protein